MTRFTHQASTEEPGLLANELGIPVLVADAPIHRRIRAHFLWMPRQDPPQIHRELAHVLGLLFRQGHHTMAVVTSGGHHGLAYYLTRLSNDQGDDEDG